jgi:YkoY family integral membrane protein
VYIEQTFALTDIPKVVVLSFLEMILSVDNLVVLALLASRLPEKLRAKALLLGSLSAIFIRALAIVFLSVLIQYSWIQILAALYLIYIATRYFYGRHKQVTAPKTDSFWKILVLIELFDLVFAVDSMVAGISFIATGNPLSAESKIWIVYLGGMIGLFGIRYFASLCTKFLHKFPKMERSAHLMIGWIGCKFIISLFFFPPLFEIGFWVVLGLLAAIGFSKKKGVYGR